MRIFSTEWLSKLESLLPFYKKKAVLSWRHAAGMNLSYGQNGSNNNIVFISGGTQEGDWANYFTIDTAQAYGTRFVATKRCLVRAHVSSNITGTGSVGVSYNSTSTNTDYLSLPSSEKVTVHIAGQEIGGGSGAKIINPGDILRIQTSGMAMVSDGWFGLVLEIDENV